MPPLLAYILNLILSWRTAAVLLALFNLKSLPFAWHARLFALMLRHGRPLRRNLDFLRKHPESSYRRPTKRSSNTPHQGEDDQYGEKDEENEKEAVHPIFRPVTINCRTSLYETDYNLHKSNSTYFADLDHSRTALVSSLLSPSIAHNTLTPHGEKAGVLYPILGSVHTSFLREIKPLQFYQIRSRLLGWDRKWLVIASYFVRPATAAERSKAKKDGKEEIKEILLACALNKYVLKQGRKTIEPGLALAASGWFTAREGVTHNIKAETGASNNFQGPQSASVLPESEKRLEESAVIISPDAGDESQEEATAAGGSSPLPQPSQTSIKTAETMSTIVRRLSSAAADQPSADNTKQSLFPAPQPEIEVHEKELGGYTFAAIETERRRGMQTAHSWMNLDIDLRTEYEQNLTMGVI